MTVPRRRPEPSWGTFATYEKTFQLDPGLCRGTARFGLVRDFRRGLGNPGNPPKRGKCDFRDLWRAAAHQFVSSVTNNNSLQAKRSPRREARQGPATSAQPRIQSTETANGRAVASPAACVTIARQPPWLPPLLRPFPPSRAEPVGLPEPWPCLPALRKIFDTEPDRVCHRPCGSFATVFVTMCRFGNSMD